MPSVLILYATREGQTEKVATRIFQYLEHAGIAAHLVNAADAAVRNQLDFSAYDLLVFGASMHAGGLEKELVQCINSNADQIAAQQRSFFLVLLSAATQDSKLRTVSLADARQKMQKQLAVVFADTEMIAGALVYSKYSWPLRWLMRRIAARADAATDPSQDYEYTDWQQVDHYAQRLVERL